MESRKGRRGKLPGDHPQAQKATTALLQIITQKKKEFEK